MDDFNIYLLATGITQAQKKTSASTFSRKRSLLKKCPYLELFWSVFSRIRTEYGEIIHTSPCSVRMGKIRTRITPNTDTFHVVDVKEIYTNLKTDDEEYNAMVDKLSEKFIPKVNVTYERYVFKLD